MIILTFSDRLCMFVVVMTTLRFVFFSIFLSLTISANGAEDCFNAIDDDNDGLIDANDPDCQCCPSTGGEYLTDGIFDAYECFSQSIYCVPFWNQNYSGSPDYLHPDWNPLPASVPPVVVPGGVPGLIGGMSQSYREGISQCLLECISRGEEYNLSFKFFSSHTSQSGPAGTPVGNSTEAIQVFGIPLCSDIEGASFDCPNSIDFDLLATGTNPSAPTYDWHSVDVTFTACRNYEAILIMHSCDAPIVIYTRIMGFSITGPGSPSVSADPIIVTGDGCNGYVLEAPNTPSGSIIQWYKEGIAIVGESGQFYNVPLGEGGNFTYGLFIDSGCDYTDPVNIEPYQLMELNPIITKPSCFGYDDGSVELLVEYGTPPYTLLLNNMSVGTLVNNLQAGTYTVNITDAEGCMATFNVSIENPNMLMGNIIDVQPVDPNTGVGSAEVLGISDHPPLLYYWSGGEIGPNVNLPVGTHTVTIYDDNFCSVELIVEIPGPPLSFDQTTFLSCPNLCNGEVLIEPIGGQSPFNILWDNNLIQGFNPSGLCPGRYNYVISDAHGTAVSNELIIEETPLIELDAIVINPPCSDTTGGSITLILDTINIPAMVTWVHGGNTHFIDNLQPNVYTAIIEYSNNCFIDSSFNIINEFDVSPTVSVQPNICALDSLGTIDVSISNQNNGYSILWQDGSTSFIRDSLPAGQFTYVITQDTSNCQYSESITISDPDPISAVYQFTDYVCPNAQTGSISIDTTGFFEQNKSYVWQDAWSGPMKSNLGPGITQFTIIDSFGCQNEVQIEILESPRPIYTFDIINPDCIEGNNGSIAILKDNSLNINWNLGSTMDTLDNLTPGTYSVILTDSFNCAYMDTVELTEQLSASFNADVINEVCDKQANGSINLVTTQGIITNYQWSNGPNEALNDQLSPGTYEVTITDSNNCTATSEYSIEQGEIIDYNTISSHNLCFGDSIGQVEIINSSGQYDYQWEHTSLNLSSISNLKAGIYSVEILTSNGCIAMDSFTIQDGMPLMIDGIVDSIECEHNFGEIQLQIDSPNDPFVVNWDDGSNDLTIDSLMPGTYIVTVTDANQCQKEQSFSLQSGFVFEYTSTFSDSICAEQAMGLISVLSNGSYNYNWGDGQTTQSIDSLTAGEYKLTITSDLNNCLIEDTFTIENFILEDFELMTQDALCNTSMDGSISLVQNGILIKENIIVNGLPFNPDSLLDVGSYTLDFLDNKGCHRVLDFEIFAPPPIVSLPLIQNPSCFDQMDGIIDINTTGGTPPYTYDWSNGGMSNFEDGLDTGVYYINILDGHNCLTEIAVTLSSHLPIDVNILAQDVLCDDPNSGAIFIESSDVINPYLYINGISSDETQTIENLTEGTYDIEYHHSENCIQYLETVEIITPVADFDIEIIEVDPSQFYPGDEGFFDVSFFNPELIQNLTITGNGQFICQTTNVDDCASFSHIIDEENVLIATGLDQNNCLISDTIIFLTEGKETILTLPNIFSPNGDSNNDTWQIEIPSEADQINVSIYDRWGNVVFRTLQHNAIWDGTFNGTQVLQGVYVVYVSYDIDGSNKSFVGDLTVIR